MVTSPPLSPSPSKERGKVFGRRVSPFLNYQYLVLTLFLNYPLPGQVSFREAKPLFLFLPLPLGKGKGIKGMGLSLFSAPLP
jgi:hypothetical protein